METEPPGNMIKLLNYSVFSPKTTYLRREVRSAAGMKLHRRVENQREGKKKLGFASIDTLV